MTRTNLVSITPNFIVKDLQASIGIHFKEVGPDVLPLPNKTRHPWAPWDAYIYTLDPDTLFDEFRQRDVSFVKELSFIEEWLWGFELTDADGYLWPFSAFATHRAGGRLSIDEKFR